MFLLSSAFVFLGLFCLINYSWSGVPYPFVFCLIAELDEMKKHILSVFLSGGNERTEDTFCLNANKR